MTDSFPTVLSPADLCCFNCGAGLAGEVWADSGNAPGSGQYQCRCPGCGLTTWFDLEAPCAPSCSPC